MTIPIDNDYIRDMLVRMVQIDSVNPDLVPGSKGEGQLARYIAGALEALGVTVHIDTLRGDRANVTGIIPGSGGGRTLMLNAHTDTVGTTGMQAPFSARIEDGKLYGRGAYDMKGSIAACLAVLRGFMESGRRLRGDLMFNAVLDEEYASIGTEDIVRRYQADAAIITEPTGLRVCRAHRGFVWIEVTTVGRAAHGSAYQDGIDANMHMGRVLVELEKLSRELTQREPHPLLGPPSLHAPLIQGGSSQSVYAARCRLELERRTLPDDTAEGVLAEVQAVLDRLAADDPQFQASARILFERPPYEIAEDAPIVQTLVKATEAVTGQTPAVYGEKWWMDSALLAAAGIETAVIGPAGGGAHADVEWVELDSVYKLARILAQAALDVCG